MTEDFRAVLSPLLFISYVTGTRIIEFPAGKRRLWFSLLYILLSWSVYHILLTYTVMYYVLNRSTAYHIALRFNMSIALLSIVLGIYYDKKYRNCLKKLAIVDDTLKKLGTAIDYQKVYVTILYIVFGWFAFVAILSYSKSFWYTDHCDALKAFYISFMLEYSSFINIIGDLIIASTLRYIELKFDQINEYLWKSEGAGEYEAKRTWDHSALLPHQVEYMTSSRDKYDATWIIMHLHLELRKICREVNSIFELEMTLKMGCYFVIIVKNFNEVFNAVFTEVYANKIIYFSVLVTVSFIVYISRLFLINYICERVTVKAKATGDLINIIPYSLYDVVLRENISQLLLQLTRAPLRFYGLGLFQFGLKFLYGFIGSVGTVIVIIIQVYTNIKCCNVSN